MGEGKGTILVVDDEPSLRLLCRVNLELEGYRVLEAGTLEEARTAMDTRAGRRRAARHARRDGARVRSHPELRELEPPAAVVVLSGTSEVTAELRARVDAVLGKPFVLEELTDTVQRVLTDARRSHA